MEKIYDDKQLTVTQERVALILRSYNIHDFSYEVIQGGLENTSLRITAPDKKYVLRIHRQGKKIDEHLSFELAFEDYLRKKSIPIPHVHPNAEGKEFTVIEFDGFRWLIILMDFAEGESVTEHYTRELIDDLAPIQARMHLLGIEYAKKYPGEKVWTELTEMFSERIKDTSVYDKELAEFIERARSFRYLFDPRLPHGWNHLDLDLIGNVLVKDNKVSAIIDFDDLDYSPAIVCFGYSLWAVFFADGEDMMRQYLREYTKVRPLNEKELDALPHIMLFRNYAIGMIELVLWKRLKNMEKFMKLEREILELPVKTSKSL